MEKNAAEQANVPGDSAATNSSESGSKVFTWSDAAVLLLMDLYREKEHEFNTGLKRHNLIWKEIAAQLQELNYEVNGLQCSAKFFGLRRMYKNIKDQNKKSDNSQSSCAFYSVMDSLSGDKAFIHPPAKASNEGPPPPTPTCSASSPNSRDLQNAPKKRKIEVVLDRYLANMRKERKRVAIQRAEERRVNEEKKEMKHQEQKMEREKMHLQTLANKK